MAANQIRAVIEHVQPDDQGVTAPTNFVTQEATCTLLSLPPEIRNTIWELVLQSSPRRRNLDGSRTIRFQCELSTSRPLRRRSPLDLLEVCRVINSEATGFYYQRIQLDRLDCSDFWRRTSQLRLNGISQLTIACEPVRSELEAKYFLGCHKELPELPNLKMLTFIIPHTTIGTAMFRRIYGVPAGHCLDLDILKETQLIETWKAERSGVEIRVCLEELRGPCRREGHKKFAQIERQDLAEWISNTMTPWSSQDSAISCPSTQR